MTIAVWIMALVAAWCFVSIYGHGSANTIDQVAWWLHRFAVTQRKMHKQRELLLQERWVKELES